MYGLKDLGGSPADSGDGGGEIGESNDDGEVGKGETDSEREALAELPGVDRHDAADLKIDEIFELLKNERRRRVIDFLKDQEDRSTTLDAVAEYIAALENDIEIAQLSSAQRKRVYIALYQCHLPKMDHFGIIDFDKNRGTIELRNTELLDPYLTDQDQADETGRDRTELMVGVLVSATVTVGTAGLGALGAVPTAFWSLLGVVTLLWVVTT